MHDANVDDRVVLYSSSGATYGVVSRQGAAYRTLVHHFSLSVVVLLVSCLTHVCCVVVARSRHALAVAAASGIFAKRIDVVVVLSVLIVVHNTRLSFQHLSLIHI